MATYPPEPTPLLTFPQATLTHHVGQSVFPLSSGPCSLVQLESGQLALNINSTTVLLGKQNRVRKTDMNEQHAAYSFNHTPVPTAPAAASSSTSGDLPTTAVQGGGFLKLTLPPSRNTEEYDNTALLARQFEGELQTHGLLDTRSEAEIEEDAQESLGAVLSGFYRSSVTGLAETGRLVYSGARELAEDVSREKETKGWWGAIKERAGSIGGTPLSSLRGEDGKGKSKGETSLAGGASKDGVLTAAALQSAGQPKHATVEEAV